MKSKSILRRIILYLCWLIILFIASLPPALAQKRTAALRVTTRLVQVNVVVLDKKGVAIPDLTSDDFEVMEQGKSQRISVFSIESNLKAVGRPEALPPNMFSNQPSSLGASQNLTVILFDALNTPIIDQANAQKEVVQFLRQIRPQDRVAVYGLGTTLHVIHDFTGNSEALGRSMANYVPRSSLEREASTAPIVDNTRLAQDAQEARIIEAVDAFLNDSNEAIANYYIERRTAITLQALEAIANHLVYLPGRKSLVWVSAGFPFSYGSDTFRIGRTIEGKKSSSEVLARTARSITNANVAIYPVDARALLGTATVSPSSSAALVTSTARQAARIDIQALDEVLASQDTMQELADQTGGRAIYNTSDVRGAIRSVLEESRVTYTLGYYPSDTRFDGKFRSLKVTVNRPGTQLRYRRGYYAFADEPLDEARRQKTLNAAASSLLDATGIGFSAEVGSPTRENLVRQLALEIDTNSIKLQPVQGKWVGGLDAMFAQFDPKGNLLASATRQVPLTLTAASRAQLMQYGLVLNVPITTRDTCERMRIVLCDWNTGAIGTLTIPMKK